MRELKELRELIEEARVELDESLETGNYEIYYKKSVKVDRLIEEYLETKAQVEISAAVK